MHWSAERPRQDVALIGAGLDDIRSLVGIDVEHSRIGLAIGERAASAKYPLLHWPSFTALRKPARIQNPVPHRVAPSVCFSGVQHTHLKRAQRQSKFY
ncbi:hypothetical protein D3C73_973800 [compost metagenome]